MVSALGTHLKLFSTELALKVIAQHEAKIDVDLGHFSLATESPERIALDTAETDQSRIELKAHSDNPNEDIASAIFMTNLKKWITDATIDAASAPQGKAMSLALTSGTLKVCDPVEGVVVLAWDIASEQPKHVKLDKITPAGWSHFLKQHVKREDGVGYIKEPDGGYVDMMSGENAYFGAVGSKLYYLTWPQTNKSIS